MIVIRKTDGLRLRVLGITELNDGRPAYSVCKEAATSPQMARFKVAQENVEPDFK